MQQSNQNEIGLSQISDIQLKAFAYDEISKIEMAQANLRIINQEINARMKLSVNVSNNVFNNSGLPVLKWISINNINPSFSFGFLSLNLI